MARLSLTAVSVGLAVAMLGALPSDALAKKKDGKGKNKEARTSVIPAPQANGLVQVWGTVFDQDMDPITDPAGYGDPEDDTGFKIRRARIGMAGDDNGIRYDVTMGYSSGFDVVAPPPSSSIQLITAEGGYRLTKGLWLTGGVQKVPVGRGFLMSAGSLALGERSVATNWSVPGRDVGLTLDGNFGSKTEGGLKGRMRAGVFNGNGQLSGDDNPGKLVAIRAEGAYGPGNAYETWGEVKSFSIGFAGDFWTDRSLSTETLGYGGDIIIRVAGLAALFETNLHTIKPVNSDLVGPGVFAETPRLGMTGQLGYSVWMLEPVVRYSRFDDHQDFEDNGDVTNIEGGVTWHGAKDAVRAGALFVHLIEGGGATIDNDTARLWMQLQF